MLIENPRKEYIKLINNAKKENRKKGKEYFEEHHILPKSMFKKWKYKKRNLVLLTPEEHYFAHYLLYLIYNNREMANAFWFMLNSTNFKYNEDLYKEVRLKVTALRYFKCLWIYSTCVANTCGMAFSTVAAVHSSLSRPPPPTGRLQSGSSGVVSRLVSRSFLSICLILR